MAPKTTLEDLEKIISKLENTQEKQKIPWQLWPALGAGLFLFGALRANILDVVFHMESTVHENLL